MKSIASIQNQFYQWKKELFEGAAAIFSTKRSKKSEQKRITSLEEKLKDRTEVIAELLEENLKLKKFNGEI